MAGNSNPDAQAGFSYVEVLIATVLIAVSLAPAMEALQTSIAAPTVTRSLTADQYHLKAKLEEVLAQSFVNLDNAGLTAGSPSTPTSYSDAAGSARRRLVFVSRYDGDNDDADNDPFTGTDAGLLWVSARIEGSATVLETLAAQ
jgi:type II secretory pathway pseudopilin PulG